jgi:hypothetical protein
MALLDGDRHVDGAGARRTALAGSSGFNIGQAEGAAFIGGFVRAPAVFLGPCAEV